MNKSVIVPIIFLIIGLGVGFLIGENFMRSKISAELEKATNQMAEDFNTESESENNEVYKDKVIIDKEISDALELATILFTVEDAKEETIIQSTYSQPRVAADGAKFIILNVEVKNTTKSPFTFSTDGILIEDTQGNQYNTYRDTIGNIDNYIEMQELSPGIAKKGVMVYEVPQEVNNYSLLIAKGGTNEIYRVKIK